MQNNRKFKLTTPKGHLISKQVYSAYSKTSLSTIPRNVEVILINKDPKTELLFSKLMKKCGSIKEEKPEPQEKILPKKKKEKLLSSFASKNNRFDEYQNFLSKYSPGPGEYLNDSGNLQLNSSSFRYQSLFSKPSKIPVKKLKKNKSISPGPGTYNPKYDSVTPLVVFAAKGDRFKENKKEKLGPGSYYNPENPMKRWDCSLPSSFFKRTLPKLVAVNKKRDELLEKYISIQKEKEYEIPGPGTYNSKSEFEAFSKAKGDLLKDSLKKSTSSLELIPEELRRKYQEKRNTVEDTSCKSDTSDKNYWKETNSKKEIRSPFLSRSKRSLIYSQNSNHIPGPCYYQRDLDKQSCFGKYKSFSQQNIFENDI